MKIFYPFPAQLTWAKKYFYKWATRPFLLILPSFAVLLFPYPAVTQTLEKHNAQWHLENPFRFFVKPEDTETHRLEWIKLTAEEKLNPVLSAERKLSRQMPFGWSSSVFRSTCWDSLNHRYKHCNGKKSGYIFPTHHRIIAGYKGALSFEHECKWRIIPAKTATHYKNLKLEAKQACSKSVKLDIPYPDGGKLVVTHQDEEIHSEAIKIKDLFVVGMGDSFASGEGNPDNPVTLSRKRTASYGLDVNKKMLSGYPTRIGEWKKVGDNVFQEGAAGWLSKACHRSLYSYQLRTALQLALDNRKRAITFISFACAGSEIPIGLFKRYRGTDWDENYPYFPQISSVANAQCGEGKAALAKDYFAAYAQRGKLQQLATLVMHKCPKRHRRKIDLLLVSVGGNDVGFSRLLANAVIKDKSALQKLGGWMAGEYGIREARRKLGELKYRYRALNKAFHYILGIPWKQSDRILLNAYPPMSYTEDGISLCKNDRPLMSVYDDFSIQENSLAKGTKFAEKLNGFMKRQARQFGWSYIEEHRDTFLKHGFCAINELAENPQAEDLRFPFFNNGKWHPYNPADFEPYASRQRWFRTPNDAYLTGHLHASGSIIRKVLRARRLAWFQVLLASTYSGSFHPTAEGHAAMADANVRRARQVLEKYGQ